MSAPNTPQQVMEAVRDQLSVISVANGYATDIGTKIFLFDGQRAQTERPSIAIGARAGVLDRTGDTGPDGRPMSRKARTLEFTLEAAVQATAMAAQAAALVMLEDIERAWDQPTGAAPSRVSRVSLLSWNVLDRPDGIDAVVLQILGAAEYRRT